MNTTRQTGTRSAVRYPLSLDARVSTMAASGGSRPVADPARTRDMSSRGVSFYSGAEWTTGEAVTMLIEFGGDLVSPFSYTLRVEGRVVRRGTDEKSGRTYHAVEFDGPGKILDWRERPRFC